MRPLHLSQPPLTKSSFLRCCSTAPSCAIFLLKVIRLDGNKLTLERHYLLFGQQSRDKWPSMCAWLSEDFIETAVIPLLATSRWWVRALQIRADRCTSTWPLPAPINVDGVSELTGNGLWLRAEAQHFTGENAKHTRHKHTEPLFCHEEDVEVAGRGRPCLTWLRDA